MAAEDAESAPRCHADAATIGWYPHGMRFHLVAALVALACTPLVLSACDSPNTVVRPDGGPRDAFSGPADLDGDTISDEHEGGSAGRDTDGDGTLDSLDEDSDGDGIPDAMEAGDTDVRTVPRDSDGDGTPDPYDTDSDNNGIPDGSEEAADVDTDGRQNAYDPDDDNDGLPDARELRGTTSPPADSDGDGIPDFHDVDSDGDTISDGEDLDVDTDMDMTPDFLDEDSDADGIPDATEAGDADLATPPVDTDMDMIADFRDPDSDGDGLSDQDEVATHMTSPTSADTDMDGVSDLIETAAGTSPTDMTDSPRTRGDFVFVVPYMEAPDPTRDTLAFRTSIQFADVYFLFDRSGSMAGEISALRTAVGTIMGDLTCTDFGVPCTRDSECAGGQVCGLTGSCIEDPGVDTCITSPWTGGGWYLGDYTNTQSLQGDPAVTSAALGFGTTAAPSRSTARCGAWPILRAGRGPRRAARGRPAARSAVLRSATRRCASSSRSPTRTATGARRPLRRPLPSWPTTSRSSACGAVRRARRPAATWSISRTRRDPSIASAIRWCSTARTRRSCPS